MLSTVVEAYQELGSIRLVESELDISMVKVRKLLITANAYDSPMADTVNKLYSSDQTIDEIMEITQLSRASVYSYLPYKTDSYKLDALSLDAENCARYRERKNAVKLLQEINHRDLGDNGNSADNGDHDRQTCNSSDHSDNSNNSNSSDHSNNRNNSSNNNSADSPNHNMQSSHEALWNCLIAFQKYPFRTVSGLQFSYTIKTGKSGELTKELWIDRKESKSLTWSSIVLAYNNAIKIKGEVGRPKALGDIRGVSYLYPIFWRFGLIRVPEKMIAMLERPQGRNKQADE